MHRDAPYTVVHPPRPYRLHLAGGVQHALLLGRRAGISYVLHGYHQLDRLTWVPDRLLVSAVPSAATICV
jgi:hypothetical protein